MNIQREDKNLYDISFTARELRAIRLAAKLKGLTITEWLVLTIFESYSVQVSEHLRKDGKDELEG